MGCRLYDDKFTGKHKAWKYQTTSCNANSPRLPPTTRHPPQLPCSCHARHTDNWHIGLEMCLLVWSPPRHCLFFLQPLFEEEDVPREGKRMRLRRHEGTPCIKGLQIMSKTASAYVMGEMV